jgi:hypothetical protein
MGGTATATQDTESAPAASSDVGGTRLADKAADDLGGLLPLRARLITLSFLQLFIQLALIRWLGAQVVYMSYYSNFVLLASFLGFGLGFLWAGTRRFAIYPYTPVLLGALVLVVYQFQVGLKWTTTDIILPRNRRMQQASHTQAPNIQSLEFTASPSLDMATRTVIP